MNPTVLGVMFTNQIQHVHVPGTAMTSDFLAIQVQYSD